MIIVDSSVWIDHLDHGDPLMTRLLDAGDVLVHPFVMGEIACGNLPNRSTVLEEMGNLYAPVVAEHGEALFVIEQQRLMGRGIGYVDVHLLASALLTDSTRLWTRDRRLHNAANELGVVFSENNV